MEQTIGGVTLETRAEVGLLTRNVVVRGSVQEDWTENIPACETEFDTSKLYESRLESRDEGIFYVFTLNRNIKFKNYYEGAFRHCFVSL